jgi:CRP-like cAMP-binding protein
MAIDDEVQILAGLPLFAGADAAALRLLAFSSELVTVLERDTLFRQGDPSTAAYVVLDGDAEVSIAGPAGPITVAVLGPRHIVGEMGALTGAPRSATVVARTRMEALAIPADTLHGILRTSPDVSIGLIQELARRIERSNALIAGLSRGG